MQRRWWAAIVIVVGWGWGWGWGCGDTERTATDRPQPRQVVAAPQDRAPDAAPALPAPRLDPTARFVRATPGVDGAGDLSMPVPWMPDAPELEALLPRGAVLRLEEEWRLVDDGGFHLGVRATPARAQHRVQLEVAPDDVAATVARLRRAVDALQARLRPTDRMMPVLTWVDDASPAGDVRIDRGATHAIGAWGDLGDRTILVAADVKQGGRTLEIALVQLAPVEDPGVVERFAAVLPVPAGLEPVLRAAGDRTEARYTRAVGRAPSVSFSGRRPLGAGEAAAVERVLAEPGDADTIERDAARLGQVRDRHEAPWRRTVRRALRRAGLRAQPGDAREVFEDGAGAYFFEDGTRWTLGAEAVTPARPRRRPTR